MTLVGKYLKEYKLLKKISKGGTSYIYLGEHSTLRDKVAIKILRSKFAKEPEIVERFQNEGEITGKLQHDHIIPIIESGKSGDDTYYIVMKYIPGGDLFDLLNPYDTNNKLMPISRWLPLLEQVAVALDYAHHNGIIHRDVKPQNILVQDNNHAYLTDFGLGLDVERGTVFGNAFGTARYIPPEQALDSGTSDVTSDVYSLCVIVYELLTGVPLFDGDAWEAATGHIYDKPIPPRHHNPQLPTNVEKEILKSLDKNPDKRHNSASGFIRAIANAFDSNERIGAYDNHLQDYKRLIKSQPITLISPPTQTGDIPLEYQKAYEKEVNLSKSRRVFISYSQQNSNQAFRIHDILTDFGCTVWIDNQLRGGQNWWKEILYRIRECDTIVIILSEAYLESEACRREWRYALQSLNKNVLPTSIEPIDFTILPTEITCLQIINCEQITDQTSELLQMAFQSLSPVPKLPYPLPSEPEAPMSRLSGVTYAIYETQITGDMENEIIQILEQYADHSDAKQKERALQILKTLLNREITLSHNFVNRLQELKKRLENRSWFGQVWHNLSILFDEED